MYKIRNKFGDIMGSEYLVSPERITVAHFGIGQCHVYRFPVAGMNDVNLFRVLVLIANPEGHVLIGKKHLGTALGGKADRWLDALVKQGLISMSGSHWGTFIAIQPDVLRYEESYLIPDDVASVDGLLDEFLSELV